MMKKNILFLALILLLGYQAKAQFFTKFKTVEARAGLNLSTINGDISSICKPGFHVGGMISYQLFDELSIRGGLMLSQKGAKFEDDFRVWALEGDSVRGGYTENMFMNAYYLEIPIMASFNIPMTSVLEGASIQLNIGPSFGIGLFGNTVYDSVDYNYPETQEVEKFSRKFSTFGGNADRSGLSRFDIGALMEVGFTWREYALQISYDYGFMTIGGKDSFIGRKGNYMGTNGTWMFTLAYKFRLNEE